MGVGQGGDAYGRLRWESGVHRVQRVPVNSKVLQTSAATVAVLADHKSEAFGDDTEFPPQVPRCKWTSNGCASAVFGELG